MAQDLCLRILLLFPQWNVQLIKRRKIWKREALVPVDHPLTASLDGCSTAKYVVELDLAKHVRVRALLVRDTVSRYVW